MTKILIALFISLISLSNVYAQQCTRSGGGDIYYKDEDGNVIPKYAPGAGRDSPTQEWVEKCAPKVIELASNDKKTGPSDEQCRACVSSNPSGPAKRGVCGNTLGCSFFQISFMTFSPLVAEMQPVVANCADAMVCSEETKLCEYLCPDNFTYNTSSGFCERPCGENQILKNNTCVACPEGTVVENNSCVVARNFCADFLENSVPYSPTTLNSVAKNLYYDRFYNSIQVNNLTVDCRVPDVSRTEFYASHYQGSGADLATLPATTFAPTPTITYAGCQWDGKISKSLYTFSSGKPPYGEFNNARNVSLKMFCVDSNTSNSQRSTLDEVISWNNSYFDMKPDHFSLIGSPVCYKWQPYLYEHAYDTPTGATALPVITTPIEDCSDCLPGQTKINGICGCPSGYKTDAAKGCVKNIGCEFVSSAIFNGNQYPSDYGMDFLSNKCSCPEGTNPYAVRGLKYAGTYQCQAAAPIKEGYDGADISTTVSGSFTYLPCEANNAYSRKVRLTLNNNSGAAVTLYAYCIEEDRNIPGMGSSGTAQMLSNYNQFAIPEGTVEIDYAVAMGSCYTYVFTTGSSTGATQFRKRLHLKYPSECAPE